MILKISLTSSGDRAHGRLVQQQHFWLAHQRTAHGQHLLLAAGERTGGLVAALLQTRQQVKDHVEVILDGLLAVAACVRAHLQVLLHGQAAEHTAALRHLRQPRRMILCASILLMVWPQ